MNQREKQFVRDRYILSADARRIIEPANFGSCKDYLQWKNTVEHKMKEMFPDEEISIVDIIAAINNAPRYESNVFVLWGRGESFEEIERVYGAVIAFGHSKKSIKELFDAFTWRVITTSRQRAEACSQKLPKEDPYVCGGNALGLVPLEQKRLLSAIGGTDIRCSEFVKKYSYEDIIQFKGFGPKTAEFLVSQLEKLGFTHT